MHESNEASGQTKSIIFVFSWVAWIDFLVEVLYTNEMLSEKAVKPWWALAHFLKCARTKKCPIWSTNCVVIENIAFFCARGQWMCLPIKSGCYQYERLFSAAMVTVVMPQPMDDGVDSCSAHYIRNYFNELKRNACSTKQKTPNQNRSSQTGEPMFFDHRTHSQQQAFYQRAYQSN